MEGQMNKASTPRLFAILLAASAFAADADKTSERIESILSDASGKRYDARAKADREYRAAAATAFKFADRVEVFLLDFSIGDDAARAPKDGDELFPIRPYDKETKILKATKVPPKDIPKWCAAVTKLITSDKPEGGALCHFPIHGLRIYARDKLLFETSICWHCSNYYFTYDGVSNWLGLTDDAIDIKKLLDDFMPIPDSEQQRFPGSKPKLK